MRSTFAFLASLGIVALSAQAAGASNFLIKVPIEVHNLPAGTTITVSCAPTTRDEDQKNKAADATLSSQLQANPPKGAKSASVQVKGGGGPDSVFKDSVTIGIDDVPVQRSGSGVTGIGAAKEPAYYVCWSDYGGLLGGKLTGGTAGPPSDSWSVTR